jgi:D-alanyl-lipoteichoic acid acyltransferase DltB (MBOAT superfamily)
VIARRLFLMVCSLLFLYLFLPNATAALTLLAFVGSGYLAGRVIAAHPSRTLLVAYLTVLVGAFVYLKRYAFLQLMPGASWLEHTLDIVGLSFIFFRQIHYVVDAKQGEVRDFSLWAYLCYQLNPFTLLAGPIQRYQQFQKDWEVLLPRHTDAAELRLAFLRILVGVVKVSLLGEVCLRLAQSPPGSLGTTGGALASFYLYPAYVYFNFAGYCDIVIAGASLAGLKVPENFNRPYPARNMIDFWTRWHMSLTFWIRDYVFTPIYMGIARRWPAKAPGLAFLCYFLALFLAGVWHGATWNFVVFGVLNGIGVSAAKVWENFLVARYGRPGLRRYLASVPLQRLAQVANFHFVCLTIVFLRPESTQVWWPRVVRWLQV